MSRYWYYYQGNINGSADLNPLNYLRSSTSPSSLCAVGGQTTCAIYSPPNDLDDTIPQAISTNIQNYLVPAKNLSTGFPVAPNKAYVYSKP